MVSTVFVLTLGVTVFVLTIATASLPEEIPRLGEPTSAKTTVTHCPYKESQNATYSRYNVEVNSRTAIKGLRDEIGTVTSESTSTAAHCSFEETTAEDLGALLDAGEGAMVTLMAWDARLTAHRAVLVARSPAFATMLCHGSQGASSGQVRVPDVEGPVLRQIHAYLYTLRAPQVPSMTPQLLAAADKFGLSGLKSECEAQMAAQLDVETAVATAVLAIRLSSTRLRQATIAFIRAHMVQVMVTQGWAYAMLHQPHVVFEVHRLLSEMPVVTSTQNASLDSTPAAADNQPTTEAQSSQGQTPSTSADSQPTTEAQSSQGQTPATTASPAPHCPTLQPDDDAVSHFRSLSSEEKGRRLWEAAKEGRVEDVEVLLAVGADVGAGDWHNNTALHYAAFSGDVEVARRLLGCGAEVDARDRWQETPLHLAAWRGSTAVARLLLAASADPNARDKYGRTPLYRAALRDHAETTAVLLEAGADREARDDRGRKPLDLARRFNRQQV